MLYYNYTEELIGLKDVFVKSVERKDNTLCIYAGMYKRIHKCPRCGERTSKVHDYRIQRIKDISAFGETTCKCQDKNDQKEENNYVQKVA